MATKKAGKQKQEVKVENSRGVGTAKIKQFILGEKKGFEFAACTGQ